MCIVETLNTCDAHSTEMLREGAYSMTFLAVVLIRWRQLLSQLL